MKEKTPAQIAEHLKWVYSRPDYYNNRRKANKKYYSQEENKQKKRDYMKDYSNRPEVIEKRRKLYQKNYHKKPKIKVDKKAYIKTYNALFCNKVKRHEWYLKRKIKKYEEEKNEDLHAQNTERLTHV